MYIPLSTVLLGLAAVGLPYPVFSRALPRTKADGWVDASWDAISPSQPPEDAVLRNFASRGFHAFDTRGLKIARADIDPIEPIDPTTPDPVPDTTDPSPVDPQNPSSPDIPATGPDNTDPDVDIPTATDEAPGPTPSDGKPPSTATASTAPVPTTVSDPGTTPPDTDFVPDQNSPGGLSGDSEDDAGGIGDGPDDDECLNSRDVRGLQKRCSRLTRPTDWTGYDDLNDPTKTDKAGLALTSAIANNVPDRQFPDFSTRYTEDEVIKANGKPVAPKSLSSLSEDLVGDVGDVDLTGSFPLKGTDMYIPSTDGKSIVVIYSDADNDIASEQRLSWSELTYQRFKNVAGDNVNKLQYVTRVQVANPGTMRTIEKAYTAIGMSYGDKKVASFSADAALGSPELEALEALEALKLTDNLKGVVWLLADHHVELGDKTLKKVTVYPIDTINANILIEVG